MFTQKLVDDVLLLDLFTVSCGNVAFTLLISPARLYNKILHCASSIFNYSSVSLVHIIVRPDTWRKRPVCVSHFTYILLESVVYAAVSVSVSFNFGCQNNLFQAIFATFLIVLRHFWKYVKFEDRYCKKLVSVTKKISVTTFINSIYQPIILRLRIWLSQFIKNDHF